MRLFFLTSLTLVAFAANSVFCRLALATGSIDAASFTTLRLCSGAVALLVLFLLKKRGENRLLGSWPSAVMLFIYAASFSFAYLRLDTGTGALILFGLVQLTMLLWALYRGERLAFQAWVGFLLAMSGLVWLLWPGLSAPDPLAGLMMAASGIAWGIYSLRGRSKAEPLAETAGNFFRAAVLALPVSLIWMSTLHISFSGAVLAVLSGALASGCGYVVWYQALAGLSASRAALVQLAVPVLAAGGGVVLLAEEISWRLLVSASLVLGGIALAIASRD